MLVVGIKQIHVLTPRVDLSRKWNGESNESKTGNSLDRERERERVRERKREKRIMFSVLVLTLRNITECAPVE